MKLFRHRIVFVWVALVAITLGSWLRAEDPPAPPAPEAVPAPTPPSTPESAPTPEQLAEEARQRADQAVADAEAAVAKARAEAEKAHENAKKTREEALAVVEKASEQTGESKRNRKNRHDSGGDRVNVLEDNHIEAGTTVPHTAIAVMGDLIVDGEVMHDAVAIMGDNTINGHVHHNAVAVMGDLRLGPTAVVDGDLVCVGGDIHRDPGAVVNGRIVVRTPDDFHGEEFFNWWDKTLKIGRPLAIGAHLGWLWIVTGFSVAIYALFGLVFPRRITECGDKLVTQPGLVILAAMLAILALPVLFVLLCITIIGIPVALLVLPVSCLVIAMFGKAAIYALIGRKLAGDRFHPAIAVIVGALLVILISLVPVVGLLLSLMIWFLGLGCAMLLMFSRPKPVIPAIPPSAPAFVSPPPLTPSPVAPVSPVPAEAGTSAAPVAEPPPVAPAPTTSAARAVAAMVVTADTAPRVGFWIRVAAAFLDFLIVVLPSGFLGMFNDGPGLFFLALAAYHAVMWHLKGTTIGGIICGLKVVRLDDRPIDWGVAIVRALSGFLSFFAAGVGFMWVAFDDEKQSWHDKIAGTTIVRVPKGTSLL